MDIFYKKMEEYGLFFALVGIFAFIIGAFGNVLLQKYSTFTAVFAFGLAMIFFAIIWLCTFEYFKERSYNPPTVSGILIYILVIILFLLSSFWMFFILHQHSPTFVYIILVVLALPFCFISSFFAAIFIIALLMGIVYLIEFIFDCFDDLRDNDFEPLKSSFIFISWILFILHFIAMYCVFYEEDPGILILALHPYAILPAFLILTIKVLPFLGKLVAKIDENDTSEPFCDLEHALK